MKKPTQSEPKPFVYEPAEVKARLAKWFPELSSPQIDALVTYQTELLKFNKTINLISPNTVKNAESVHIADSVLASRLIVPALVKGQPVFDFGSGNGCPGLILGLLYPTLSVTLVDRDQRKLEFCKHAAAQMGVKNVTALVKGIEDLESGSVRNVVARGFAPFARALLICRKQVAKGGRFFHMKSDGWANELAQMPSQLFTHWAPSLLGQYRLPDTSTDMFVVQTEKMSD